jgi:hypothetical protein
MSVTDVSTDIVVQVGREASAKLSVEDDPVVLTVIRRLPPEGVVIRLPVAWLAERVDDL